MAEYLSIHQIVTRDRKGGPRIIIPANSRFDTADYPMISNDEWKAMLQGERPIIRTFDDPAFVAPAQRAAAAEEVSEGRSPRTDLAAQAAKAAEREEAEEAGEEDEDEDEVQPARRGRGRPRATEAEDEV